MSKTESKASSLPVICAAISIVISIGIFVLTKSIAHAFILHLVGYVLTPLVVALCMAWDSIAQRVGRGNDPWYTTNAKYPLILRILTGLSLVVCFPHIISMATDIAEKL